MNFRIQLRMPPSANHIWRSVGKRVYRSEGYLKWLHWTVPQLRLELPVLVPPVGVSILLIGGKGFPPHSDLDNRIKPILDALRHAQRIADDNTHWIKRIDVRYQQPEKAGSFAACQIDLEDGSSA